MAYNRMLACPHRAPDVHLPQVQDEAAPQQTISHFQLDHGHPLLLHTVESAQSSAHAS